MNISVGQNDKTTVSGAWGKCTLDVAADGTRTSTKSGLVITDFEKKGGMAFVVTGKFSETNVGGTFLVSGSSGSEHKGIDIESVLNEDRQHFLDDTTISGDTAGLSLTFSGPDHKFGMGSSSGSGSTTVHHLDERFLGETRTSGNEWERVGTSGRRSRARGAVPVGKPKGQDSLICGSRTNQRGQGQNKGVRTR